MIGSLLQIYFVVDYWIIYNFYFFIFYSKNQTKAKQISIGRKKFNMDPKKGIEFLVEHGLLNHNEADVAAFLYKGEGLNKTAIGDYLGERNDFNERVLREFVSLHDFTDLILVQALRYATSFYIQNDTNKY